MAPMTRARAGEERIPNTVMAQYYAQRASAGFHQHGLSRTKARNGVLLFISRLEHRVIVLADSGVDGALDADESWQDVVSLVLAGIRKARLADGIVSGVENIGAILARHMPAPPRNLDELPTALVVEDH